VGVRINIDVLNAAQQLFSTQRDLSRARYDVLLNGLRLKNAAGDLTEADVARVNGLLEPEPPAPPPATPPTSGGAPAATAVGRPGVPAPAAVAPPALKPGGGVPAARGGRAAQPTAPR
jgi:outer membrane protein